MIANYHSMHHDCSCKTHVVLHVSETTLIAGVFFSFFLFVYSGKHFPYFIIALTNNAAIYGNKEFIASTKDQGVLVATMY